MRGAATSITAAAVVLLLGANVARADKPDRGAQGREPAIAAAAVAKPALFTDPYRRYFSGHYCDCWRKANALPIDEKSMFAGVLPRGDTLPWSKKKVINMGGLGPDEKFLCRVFSGVVNQRKGM